MNKDTLFLSIVDDKLRDSFLDLVLDINMNLEIPIFCLPEILDGDWKYYVEKIILLLDSKELSCGMHGPFHNLAYHSRDPLIREVAIRRMRQGIQIAEALNARFIVFHSAYSQFIAIKNYYKKWPFEAMRGLPQIVQEAEERGVFIVIENIWDDGPLALKALLDNIKSQNLKICIDVGHLNIFSKVPLEEWFEVLAQDIAHFHLHNNFGIIDDHNALLEGTFDFDELFNLIHKYSVKATYTLELEKIEGIQPSVEFLRQKGFLSSGTE